MVLNEATKLGAGYYGGSYGRHGYYGPAISDLPAAVPPQLNGSGVTVHANGTAQSGSTSGRRRRHGLT